MFLSELAAYVPSMTPTVVSLAERARPVLLRYGVRRASVFGSYARGEAGPASDLDLLVELPTGASLLDLVALEQDLTDVLGVTVQATTLRALHPIVRERAQHDEVRIL